MTHVPPQPQMDASSSIAFTLRNSRTGTSALTEEAAGFELVIENPSRSPLAVTRPPMNSKPGVEDPRAWYMVNHAFYLVFPPDTLAEPAGLALAGPSSWFLQQDTWRADPFQAYFLVNYGQVQLGPGESTILSFAETRAVAGRGTRSARVQLRYQRLFVADRRSDGELIHVSGRRVRPLSILQDGALGD